MSTNLDQLKERLPDHARDLRINLGLLTTDGALTPRQRWATALTAALAARNPEVTRAVARAAAPHLDEKATHAVKAAASVMAMNNVYYRFVHFMGDGSEYKDLPARLRMQVIGNPGVDHADFELWCLAASAVTGCEMCVRAHERVVRDKGLTSAHVQEAVRVAAVVHALAATLDGVEALADAPVR
jgi:alkyl hydroperoxide reductase subunit D